MLARGNFAANIYLGALGGNTAFMMEARPPDCIAICGTNATHQMGVIAATSDYYFLGGELFAGGAFLSGEPMQIGTIFGEDIVKWVVTAIFAIGTVLFALGIPTIAELIRV
jgi:hypothetical protein